MAHQVTYEFSIDDSAALMEYHRRTSPALRSQTMIRVLVVYVTLELLGLWLWLRHPNETLSYLGSMIAFVAVPLGVLLGLFFRRRNLRRLSRKILTEGKNRAIQGTRTLRLTEEAFESETALVRSIFKWPAMERIAETAEYAFLFIGGFSAIVIPRRAFTSEIEWRSFVEECRRRATEAEYVDHKTMKLKT